MLKREEMAGGWRRLHNEELHNLYPSPNIRVIESKMIWAGHVARTGEMRHSTKSRLENLKGRDHSEDLGVAGRII
jgi:hypothetical protein